MSKFKLVTNKGAEVFQDEEEGTVTVEGSSIQYNQVVDRPGLPVMFEEGSFQGAAGDDIVALFNHDSNFPIGRESQNTLEVTESEKGLNYSIDLPNSPLGENVSEAVRRGDVVGASAEVFSDDERTEEINNVETRVIESFEIPETGPVTCPAFDTSEANIQMSDEQRSEYEEWQILHDIVQKRCGVDLMKFSRAIAHDNEKLICNLINDLKSQYSFDRLDPAEAESRIKSLQERR